jgi:hypothetical protein
MNDTTEMDTSCVLETDYDGWNCCSIDEFKLEGRNLQLRRYKELYAANCQFVEKLCQLATESGPVVKRYDGNPRVYLLCLESEPLTSRR